MCEILDKEIIPYKENYGNREVFEAYCNLLNYTREDMARVITDEQARELCLRRKCKVGMYKWNPVWDIQRALKRKGRLDNKKPEQILRSLVKRVNHYKPGCLYEEEEIRTALAVEWRRRKKINLLSLELWQYQREHPYVISEVNADSSSAALCNEIAEISSESTLGDLENLAIESEKSDTGNPSNISIPSSVSNNVDNNTHTYSVLNDFMILNTESMDLYGVYEKVVNISNSAKNNISNINESLSLNQTVAAEQKESQMSLVWSQYDDFDANITCSSTQEVLL